MTRIDPVREDHSCLPSCGATTVPHIRGPVPTSTSNPTVQQVQTVPSVPVPVFPPSKQIKRPNLRTASINNLFNPIEGEDHASTGSKSGYPLKRLDSYTHSFQAQGLTIHSLAPAPPGTRNIIPITQCSVRDQTPYTGPRMAFPTPLVSQLPPLPGLLSSSNQSQTMKPGPDSGNTIWSWRFNTSIQASWKANERVRRMRLAATRGQDRQIINVVELMRKVRTLKAERD